ncbi:hypothetical protein KM043_003547 [Ampulex compressa]|nr:hypothetical protein KM043_003547 [Ampulex compressa]
MGRTVVISADTGYIQLEEDVANTLYRYSPIVRHDRQEQALQQLSQKQTQGKTARGRGIPGERVEGPGYRTCLRKRRASLDISAEVQAEKNPGGPASKDEWYQDVDVGVNVVKSHQPGRQWRTVDCGREKRRRRRRRRWRRWRMERSPLGPAILTSTGPYSLFFVEHGVCTVRALLLPNLSYLVQAAVLPVGAQNIAPLRALPAIVQRASSLWPWPPAFSDPRIWTLVSLSARVPGEQRERILR